MRPDWPACWMISTSRWRERSLLAGHRLERDHGSGRVGNCAVDSRSVEAPDEILGGSRARQRRPRRFGRWARGMSFESEFSPDTTVTWAAEGLRSFDAGVPPMKYTFPALAVWPPMIPSTNAPSAPRSAPIAKQLRTLWSGKPQSRQARKLAKSVSRYVPRNTPSAIA